MTFRARGRATYTFALECRTASETEVLASAGFSPVLEEVDEAGSPRGPPPASVEVLARADYPILRITDVCCDRFGKRTLWHQMGASEINSVLAATLTPEEEELRAAAGKAKVGPPARGFFA